MATAETVLVLRVSRSPWVSNGGKHVALPAPDVDNAAIAAAKFKIGAGAQATLDTVRHLTQRTVTLLSAQSVLRESVYQQTEILNSDIVVARLREKPVTALKDVAGRGARLNQRERAGFRTVADLLDAPAHALHAVPGVGPQTVQQVVEAAKDADRRAVDTAEHRPAVLDDESVPLERRIILAEEHRLRHSTDDREDQGHDR